MYDRRGRRNHYSTIFFALEIILVLIPMFLDFPASVQKVIIHIGCIMWFSTLFKEKSIRRVILLEHILEATTFNNRLEMLEFVRSERTVIIVYNQMVLRV